MIVQSLHNEDLSFKGKNYTKKLYEKSGYVDINYILSKGLPFNFVVGGRGTGKTYGGIKWMHKHDGRFIFMRRTQTQIDLLSSETMSPFKKYNSDAGINWQPKTVNRYVKGVFNCDSDNKIINPNETIGIMAALSTFSNLRGFDASDMDFIIFDEFIPERHESLIKHEDTAFLNMYETVNRNRELEGFPPVQCLCLANANNIANPLFMGLNLIEIVYKMYEKGLDVQIIPERGVGIFVLKDSIISEKKSHTALYELTNNINSEFKAMAINNQFVRSDGKFIKSANLKEYKPIVTIGDITIYGHKSERRMYVSMHRSGSVPEFSTEQSNLWQFRASYLDLWKVYMQGNMYFENLTAKVTFETVFKTSFGG